LRSQNNNIRFKQINNANLKVYHSFRENNEETNLKDDKNENSSDVQDDPAKVDDDQDQLNPDNKNLLDARVVPAAANEKIYEKPVVVKSAAKIDPDSRFDEICEHICVLNERTCKVKKEIADEFPSGTKEMNYAQSMCSFICLK
jgi:hypothetical protein